MQHLTPLRRPVLAPATAMLLLLVLFVVALPSRTTAQVGTSGGWSPIAITPNASALLERALQNESSYREGVTARVCVFEIRSLSQQVVSGMNYRYDVQACPVNSVQSAGMCAVKTLTTNSSCSEYEIQLYEQTWTNTLQVTSITLLSQGDVGGDADATASSASNSTNTSASTTTTSAPSGTSDKSSSTIETPSPTPSPTKSSAVSAFSSSSIVVTLVGVCLAALAASDW